MSSTTLPETYWATKGGFLDVAPVGAAPVTADQVADRMGIADTFSRYAIGWDEGLIDVVLSAFTEDVEYSGSMGGRTGGTTITGREELRRVFAARWADVVDNLGQRRHCITNICVGRLDGNHASAVAYCGVTASSNGLHLKASVFYSVDLEKSDEDGCWRFSRFFLGMDEYAQIAAP